MQDDTFILHYIILFRGIMRQLKATPMVLLAGIVILGLFFTAITTALFSAPEVFVQAQDFRNAEISTSKESGVEALFASQCTIASDCISEQLLSCISGTCVACGRDTAGQKCSDDLKNQYSNDGICVVEGICDEGDVCLGEDSLIHNSCNTCGDYAKCIVDATTATSASAFDGVCEKNRCKVCKEDNTSSNGLCRANCGASVLCDGSAPGSGECDLSCIHALDIGLVDDSNGLTDANVGVPENNVSQDLNRFLFSDKAREIIRVTCSDTGADPATGLCSASCEADILCDNVEPGSNECNAICKFIGVLPEPDPVIVPLQFEETPAPEEGKGEPVVREDNANIYKGEDENEFVAYIYNGSVNFENEFGDFEVINPLIEEINIIELNAEIIETRTLAQDFWELEKIVSASEPGLQAAQPAPEPAIVTEIDPNDPLAGDPIIAETEADSKPKIINFADENKEIADVKKEEIKDRLADKVKTPDSVTEDGEKIKKVADNLERKAERLNDEKNYKFRVTSTPYKVALKESLSEDAAVRFEYNSPPLYQTVDNIYLVYGNEERLISNIKDKPGKGAVNSKGNKIEFSDSLLNGMDISYGISSQGLSAEFIFNTPTALPKLPNDFNKSETKIRITETLKVGDGLRILIDGNGYEFGTEKAVQNEVTFLDENGTEVFTMPKPRGFDGFQKITLDSSFLADIDFYFVSKPGSNEITAITEAPYEWFFNPLLKYPLKIDPAIYIPSVVTALDREGIIQRQNYDGLTKCWTTYPADTNGSIQYGYFADGDPNSVAYRTVVWRGSFADFTLPSSLANAPINSVQFKITGLDYAGYYYPVNQNRLPILHGNMTASIVEIPNRISSYSGTAPNQTEVSCSTSLWDAIYSPGNYYLSGNTAIRNLDNTATTVTLGGGIETDIFNKMATATTADDFVAFGFRPTTFSCNNQANCATDFANGFYEKHYDGGYATSCGNGIVYRNDSTTVTANDRLAFQTYNNTTLYTITGTSSTTNFPADVCGSGTTDINSNYRAYIRYPWYLTNAYDASNNSDANSKPQLIVNYVSSSPATITAVVDTKTNALKSELGEVDLSWSDATDETGYDVLRSTDGSGYSVLISLNPNSTTYSNVNLASGTNYWYKIRTKGTTGTYDSNASAVTTWDTNAPAHPSNFAAGSSTYIPITWTDNAENFSIERSADSGATWVPIGGKYEKFDSGGIPSGWTSQGTVSVTSGELNMTGTNSWTTTNFISDTAYARTAGLVYEGFIKAIPANVATMIGFKDNGAGVSYSDGVHMIYFYGAENAIKIYEDGANRGTFDSFVGGQDYHWKIVLKSTGAYYYVNDRLIYNSSYSSESNLKPYIVHYRSTNTGLFDNIRVIPVNATVGSYNDTSAADNATPNTPTGLTSFDTDSTGTTLLWNASSDNGTTYQYVIRPYDTIGNFGQMFTDSGSEKTNTTNCWTNLYDGAGSRYSTEKYTGNNSLRIYDGDYHASIDTAGATSTNCPITGLVEGQKYLLRYKTKASTALSNVYSGNCTWAPAVPVSGIGCMFTSPGTSNYTTEWEEQIRVGQWPGGGGTSANLLFNIGDTATGTYGLYDEIEFNEIKEGTVTTGVEFYRINCVSGPGCTAGTEDAHDGLYVFSEPTISGLTSGSTYCFTISAIDFTGNESTASAQECATTTGEAPSISGVDVVSNLAITVNWGDVTGENSYKVWRSTDNFSSNQTLANSPLSGTTSYADSGLDANTTYWYKIGAVFGGTDFNSTSDFNTTYANIPGTPTLDSITGTSINVTIDTNSNPSATQFAIYENSTTQWVQTNGNLGASEAWQTNTQWGTKTTTGLTPGQQYCFKVMARNSDLVNTALSEQACSTTTIPVPSNPQATVDLTKPLNSSDAKITLSWTDNSSNETGFEIDKKIGQGSFSQLTTTAANATSYVDTTVDDNVLYTYRIRATNNGSVDSNNSAAVSVITPDRSSPIIPATFTANAQNEVELAWSLDSGYVGSNSSTAAFYWDATFAPASETGFDQDYYFSTNSNIVRRYSGDFTYLNQITTYYTYTGMTFLGNNGTNNVFFTQDWFGHNIYKWHVTNNGSTWTNQTAFVATTNANNDCIGLASDGKYLYCNANGSAFGNHGTSRSGRVDRYLVNATSLTYKGYFDLSNFGEGIAYSNGYLYVGGSDAYTDGTNDKIRVYDITNWPDGTGEWNELPYLVTTIVTSSQLSDFDSLLTNGHNIIANDSGATTNYAYKLLDRFSVEKSTDSGTTFIPLNGEFDDFTTNQLATKWTNTTGFTVTGGELFTTTPNGGIQPRFAADITSGNGFVYNADIKVSGVGEVGIYVGGHRIRINGATGIQLLDVSGAPTISIPMSMSIGQWYNWKVVYDGAMTKFYVDDALAFERTDMTYNTVFGVHYDSEGGNDTWWDNVWVKPLIGHYNFTDSAATDTTAPNMPTNEGTSGTATVSLNVDWNASTDNGTDYNYTIQTFDEQGNSSDSSSVASNTVTSGLKQYWVNCVSGGTCTTGADVNDKVVSGSTSTTVTGLSAGTQYCFTITATDNADNNSTATSQQCGTTNLGGSLTLTATAQTDQPKNSGLGRITLSWNDLTGETGYDIFRSIDNSTFTKIASAIAAGTTSYSNDNLTDNTVYYYKVQAISSDPPTGDVNSNVATTRTYDRTATSIISNLAGSYSLDAIGLTWTKSTDNVDSQVNLDYNVMKSSTTDTNSAYVVLSKLDDAGSYSDTSGTDNDAPIAPTTPSITANSGTQLTVNINSTIDQGTGYYYKVISIDTNSNDSNSNTINVLANSGIGKYWVTNTTLSTTDLNTGTTLYTATGLDVNTNYCFTVKAGDRADNNSTSSGQACKFTLANIPGTPTVNNPTATTIDVILDINSNPSATQFAIYENSTTQWVQTNGTLGASEAWQTNTQWGTKTTTGLTANTQYCFVSKARNGNLAETAFGPQTCATTLGVFPATDLSANFVDTFGLNSGKGDVSLSWTDNSVAENGYYVYRSINGTVFENIAGIAANSVAYSDTNGGNGLNDNRTLWYKVGAYVGATDENSNTANTFISDRTSPNIINLTVNPNNIQNKIGLTWTGAGDNNTSNSLIDYNILRTTTVESDLPVFSGNPIATPTGTSGYDDTSATDTTAPNMPTLDNITNYGQAQDINIGFSAVSDNGTTYYYAVASIDEQKNSSNSTNKNGTVITGINDYNITDLNTGISYLTTDTDETNHWKIITDLSSGSQHCFVMQARDVAGNSSAQSNQTCTISQAYVKTSTDVNGFFAPSTTGEPRFVGIWQNIDANVHLYCSSATGNFSNIEAGDTTNFAPPQAKSFATLVSDNNLTLSNFTVNSSQDSLVMNSGVTQATATFTFYQPTDVSWDHMSSWIEKTPEVKARVRAKTASTQAGLTATEWSSWNLPDNWFMQLTANKWIQVQIDLNNTNYTNNINYGRIRKLFADYIASSGTDACAQTVYRVDTDSSDSITWANAGAFTEYDSNILFNSDGNYALEFKSISTSGNQESAQKVIVLIDKVPEQITLNQDICSGIVDDTGFSVNWDEVASNAGVFQYKVVASNTSAFTNKKVVATSSSAGPTTVNLLTDAPTACGDSICSYGENCPSDSLSCQFGQVCTNGCEIKTGITANSGSIGNGICEFGENDTTADDWCKTQTGDSSSACINGCVPTAGSIATQQTWSRTPSSSTNTCGNGTCSLDEFCPFDNAVCGNGYVCENGCKQNYDSASCGDGVCSSFENCSLDDSVCGDGFACISGCVPTSVTQTLSEFQLTPGSDQGICGDGFCGSNEFCPLDNRYCSSTQGNGAVCDNGCKTIDAIENVIYSCGDGICGSGENCPLDNSACGAIGVACINGCIPTTDNGALNPEQGRFDPHRGSLDGNIFVRIEFQDIAGGTTTSNVVSCEIDYESPFKIPNDGRGLVKNIRNGWGDLNLSFPGNTFGADNNVVVDANTTAPTFNNGRLLQAYNFQVPQGQYNFSDIKPRLTLDINVMALDCYPDCTSADLNKVSIYDYNETTEEWSKIPSIVDLDTNKVYADLNHFSTYGLGEDNEGPALSSIVINDSDGYTNDSTPALTITASADAAEMAFSCNDSDFTSWVTFASSYSSFDITQSGYGCLNGANGNATAYVKARDDLANESATVNDTTYYDATDPAVSISSPANGASTSETSITVTYNGTDADSGIKNYWVSSDGTNWTNNGTSTGTTFSPQTTGDHTYYVKATDNADNNSSAASVTITITSGSGGGGPVCGNLICEGEETSASCPADCGTTTGTETCDNIDNDNDGLVDEGLTQSCGTCGTQTCSAGIWGTCNEPAACGAADLSVFAYATDSQVEYTKQANIAVTVQNTGESTNGSFQVRVTDGDSYTETKTVSTLASNDAIGLAFTVPFSQTNAGQTKNYTITVDSANQIIEIDETNNTETFSMKFGKAEACGNLVDDDFDGYVDEGCGLPNLHITGVEIGKPVYVGDELVQVDFTITLETEFENVDLEFVVAYFKDTLNVNDRVTLELIDSLQIGEQVKLHFVYTAPIGEVFRFSGETAPEKALFSGLTNFYVKIDSDNAVNEVNEADNLLTLNIENLVPDLLFESTDIPSTSFRSAGIPVKGIVLNSGMATAEAGSYQVTATASKVQVSGSDANPIIQIIPVKTVTIDGSALAENETKDIELTITGLDIGQYLIYFEVDSLNELAETNEINNLVVWPHWVLTDDLDFYTYPVFLSKEPILTGAWIAKSFNASYSFNVSGATFTNAPQSPYGYFDQEYYFVIKEGATGNAFDPTTYTITYLKEGSTNVTKDVDVVNSSFSEAINQVNDRTIDWVLDPTFLKILHYERINNISFVWWGLFADK